MRTSLLTLTAALALTLAACGSHAPQDEQAGAPCICGTDEALLDGCAHPLCLADQRNPENPYCVCGTLTFEEDK